MTPPPINIDGTNENYSNVTIDGQDVTQITIDGQDVLSTIPDSGIAHWTFDDADTSGGTANDVWNGNDATINGPTTGVSGANQTYSSGEAYDFDGTDDYIVQNTAGTFDATSDFSVAFWFNPDQLEGSTDIRLFELRADVTFLVGIGRAGADTLGINVGSDVGIKTLSSANTWYHVAVTHDASTTEFVAYVDNTQELTHSASISNNNKFANTIGVDAGGSAPRGGYFDGQIDDLRLYDKPLSATEVNNLYNTGSI